jgi:hypothetical protein
MFALPPYPLHERKLPHGRLKRVVMDRIQGVDRARLLDCGVDHQGRTSNALTVTRSRRVALLTPRMYLARIYKV